MRSTALANPTHTERCDESAAADVAVVGQFVPARAAETNRAKTARSPGRRPFENRKLALALWTAGVIFFLYIPTLLLVTGSFNNSPTGTSWEGFTLKWYVKLFGNDPILVAFKNSVITAAATVVISIATGTAGGWLLYRYKFRFSPVIGFLIFVPMVIPEVLMGTGLVSVFVLSNIPLGFLTNIIAHTTLCFPFVLVAIQARLNGMDPALEEAAGDLGATPWQAFRMVTLPYLQPAIISGALMTLTVSFDEYLITAFTSGPESQTLPLKIYGMAKIGLNPQINALAALLVVTTTVFVLVTDFLLRKDRS
jgi:spermidine/putrescine transport system permease protein